MSARLATPTGTGLTVQPCAHCALAVEYRSEIQRWAHAGGSIYCAPISCRLTAYCPYVPGHAGECDPGVRVVES